MSNKQLKASKVIAVTNHVSLTGEFSMLYGASAFSKFDEILMRNAGRHLFFAALGMNLIRLGLGIYNYYNKINKNLNDHTGLGWTVLQTVLPSVAIAGLLAAAATFVLIAPILFVVVMGLDMLRNFSLLLWNITRLAMLRFSVRGKLDDPEDPLTTLEYEKLKEIYINNIGDHFVGTLVSALVTVATVFIFLLPHVSAAAAAVAATAVAIGAFKTTIAGAFGFLAAGSMITGLAYEVSKQGPKLAKAFKKAASFVSSLFSRFLGENNDESVNNENEPLIPPPTLADQGPVIPRAPHPQPRPEKSAQVQRAISFIKNNLDKAIDRTLDHHGFFSQRNFREIIIDHIEDKELAKAAIWKMVQKKIKSLEMDREEDKSPRQEGKRLEKIKALKWVMQYINNPRSEFKDEKKGELIKFDNAKCLIKRMNQIFPEIDNYNSFFHNESDTRNVITALRRYYKKFEKVQKQEAPATAHQRAS